MLGDPSAFISFRSSSTFIFSKVSFCPLYSYLMNLDAQLFARLYTHFKCQFSSPHIPDYKNLWRISSCFDISLANNSDNSLFMMCLNATMSLWGLAHVRLRNEHKFISFIVSFMPYRRPLKDYKWMGYLFKGCLTEILLCSGFVAEF